MRGRVKASRSRNMAAIRSKNTKPERALNSHFRRLGLKFSRHSKALPGRPDFVFKKERVVVFCDGDFWHGRNWKDRKRLGFRVRSDYWITKIERTMRRDKILRRELRKLGWIVVRVWASQVEESLDKVSERILKALATNSNT